MLYKGISELFASLAPESRIIGIDYGEKKVGLAVSDTTYLIATPYRVYIRRNTRSDLGELAAIMRSLKVGAIVLGMPYESDGSEGAFCFKVRNFANKISRKSGLGVYLHDERFSTAMASRITIESGLRRKESQVIDDKIAAALILQQVLDMARNLGT
ncbi:MAG: Holliday junction resolvase RuvX [Aaplasma endosymbiont of Hyalomma asiaticum]